MIVVSHLLRAGICEEHGYVGAGGIRACPKCYMQGESLPGRRVQHTASTTTHVFTIESPRLRTADHSGTLTCDMP